MLIYMRDSPSYERLSDIATLEKSYKNLKPGKREVERECSNRDKVKGV
jgi:hypothetical protein